MAGEQAAAARSPARLRVSSRLRRVAASIAMTAPGGQAPRRRAARGSWPCLRQLEIVEQAAGAAQLGAREAAEAVERRDPEELLQPARSPFSLSKRALGSGESVDVALVEQLAAMLGIAQQAVGQQDLAGIEPRQLGARARSRAIGCDCELAGRDVGQARPIVAARSASAARQLWRARVEQRLLGQRARRDEADDVAPRPPTWRRASSPRPGPSICSQIATLKPLRISRAR